MTTQPSPPPQLRLAPDSLSAEDRAALQRIPDVIWDERLEIALEWSRRLVKARPEYFNEGQIPFAVLTDLNARFLTLVLERLRKSDLAGLQKIYYDANRRLIDGDLEQGNPVAISLESLYASALLSRQVIDEWLGPDNADLSLAYTRLSVELMMIVSRAYSDSHEEHLKRRNRELERAQAQVRRLNASLERRVEARTAELARSNAELEHFANVASHDLQEPLRAVANYAQLLAEHLGDRLDANSRNYVDRAVRAVSRMQQQIRDLLEYSRVTSHRGEPERVNCNDVLADVLEDLRAGIADSGAAVEHPRLPSVLGDRTQIRQLFQNLIGNALKFARDGEAPRVELEAGRDGDHWLFTVRDHGIGIEPRHAERVFVIFQRLHARGRYPGTGMGLALCKKIVEQHGGRIWVESRTDGDGATFRFQLPAAPDAGRSREDHA